MNGNAGALPKTRALAFEAPICDWERHAWRLFYAYTEMAQMLRIAVLCSECGRTTDEAIAALTPRQH